VRFRPSVAASIAALTVLGALACSGGGTPQQQIQSRVQSFVTHFNEDDAKAILDDDVPPSFRRSCSDADAKQTINQARKFGAKLAVKSVSNIAVNGDHAAAQVVLTTGVGLAPQTPAVTVPFVKNAGAWRFDAPSGNGCNNILPTSLGRGGSA